MAAGLIGLDFDGTLLRGDGTVSQRSVEALDAARSLGWIVVGATGRPRALAEIVARQVPAMSHLVCLNGTQIIDVESQLVALDHLISFDAALNVADQARAAHPDAGFAFDLADGSQLWEPGFADRVPSPPLGASAADAVAQLRQFGAASDAASSQVRKVLVWSDSVSTEALTQSLTDAVGPSHGVSHAGLAFVEIGAPGVSKASSLHIIADWHGVDIESCWVFGDARNDHQMLTWAGRGVAMANADAQTKALATHLTASNDDDGVAQFIETHLLTT